MPRVLVADKLESAGLDFLRGAGVELDIRPGLKGAELVDALRAADAVICRSKPDLTAEVLSQLATGESKLRAIARAGVGVDNIDVPAATRLGIVVMNTPGGNTVSAAEHTIALMMALSRQIAPADAKMKAGGWDRASYVGSQLTGKTIGVVGLGRIGQEVAKRATGLGMSVLGFDPFVTSAKAAELGITATSNIDELLPRVDYLTLHVPLLPETRNLIGRAQLAAMKRTARVMNVARGGIIDEVALAEALHAKTIAGAAIDVFEAEPPPADHPLRGAPNCLLTPHLGASTVEAQENVALEAAQLVIDFLTKGVVANAVNMAALDRTELEGLKQYIGLARRLGLLLAQVAAGPIQRVQLTYKGDLAAQKTKLLTAAFTAGMLEYRLGTGVNLVNALVVARDRGIEVGETLVPKRGDFASLMQAEIETDSGKELAAGTLFGDQYQRLVQFGPFRLESYLDGTLFFFHHTDAPGLIGFVGTLFGKYGVNIAAMAVGRANASPGGPAVGVLNLDSLPPDEAVAAVRAHPQVSSARVVSLPARE